MLKKHKIKLIMTSVIILLPILAGLMLWDKLPEQIPTHWGINGEPDGWSSRGVAVFFLPLFLLAIHWFGLLATTSDKRNANQTKKMMAPLFWICPVVSLLGNAAIYFNVLGYSWNITKLPAILLGALFLYVGNYMPKCTHNYTIGIKLPWTLASEENWNATHRFAGKVWVAGSIVMLLLAFLPGNYMPIGLFANLVIMVALPTVYSYRYMKKHE